MGGVRPRAALLDALGTLLWLEPPAPALRRELDARAGLQVDEETARAAMAAEIAYYRAHNLEGGDRNGLAELRRRCAAAVREALAERGRQASLDAVHDALLAALRFRPFPDVPDGLARLRRAGVRLVVVSNWDVSLHDRLVETGIADLVDGAITSAELGAPKPDPAIFGRALAIAGVPAEAAIHAGDSLHEDVAGARGAGVEPVLVWRDGEPPAAARGVPTVRGLGELADLAGA
jgi:putative hydrolase of the HAD superfamily